MKSLTLSISIILLLGLISIQCSVTHVPYKKRLVRQRYYVNTKLPKHVQAKNQIVQRDSIGPDSNDEKHQPWERMPVPIKVVPPKYPPEAEQADLEGTVWIKSLVDTNGNATNAIVIKSDAEIFNDAAITSVLQWNFSPGRLDGKTTSMWHTTPIRFKLNQTKKTDITTQFPAGDIPDSIKYSLKTVPVDTALEKHIQLYNPYDDADAFFPLSAMPKPVKQVEAEILNPERLSHLRGVFTVSVKCIVNSKGDVSRAEVLKTDAEIFNDAAINAALQWKFSPARFNDKPVAVWIAIPFKFKLGNK
jgi:TonB family protein